MSLQQKIQASRPKRDQLQQQIAETDYAAAALRQHEQYIADTQKEIIKQQKVVKDAHFHQRMESLDHDRYKDSVMKKWSYKLTGQGDKFDAKMKKEEREWLDAQHAEFLANQALELLQGKLTQALQTKAELEAAEGQNAQLKVDLDNLFNSIFQGPTPDLPEEDAKEMARTQAQMAFDQAQYTYNSEAQVLSILQDASKYLERAQQDIKSALDASSMDMWGVGGSYADMAERTALSRAQSHASQVEMLFSQARRLQPQIPDLPPIKISQGNIMGDLIFDNIFSDMAFHDKIHASEQNLQQVQNALTEHLNVANGRERYYQIELEKAKSALEVARVELQQIRMEAYDRATGGGGNADFGFSVPQPQHSNDEAPPAYSR